MVHNGQDSQKWSYRSKRQQGTFFGHPAIVSTLYPDVWAHIDKNALMSGI